MSDIVTKDLTADEARTLTDKVRARAAELWADLLALYEGNAHSALGYSSWGDYYAEEFGESKTRGYALLEAARIDRLITHSQISERPANGHVARGLVPVLRDEGPGAVEEVWGEVVNEHGPKPTAANVADAVRRRNGDAPESHPEIRLPATNVRKSTLADLTPPDPTPVTPVKTMPDPVVKEAVNEILNGWRTARNLVSILWEKERGLRFDYELDERLDGLLLSAREQAERAVRGEM